MSRVLAEFKQKSHRLPELERTELAFSPIKSLDDPPDKGVEEASHCEISRRMAEIERGEAKLIPADEDFVRLRPI